MTPAQQARAKQAAETWNHKHPVGTRVIYCDGVMRPIDTRTRSYAWVVDCGVAVVNLEGFTGCYAIDHLTSVQPETTQ